MGGDWHRICDPGGASPRNLSENSPSVLGFRPRLASPRLWAGILEVRVVTERSRGAPRFGGCTWWRQTARVRIPALPLAKLFNLSVPPLTVSVRTVAPTSECWGMGSEWSLAQSERSVNVSYYKYTTHHSAVPLITRDSDYGSLNNAPPQRYPRPNPWDLGICCFSWQKGRCRGAWATQLRSRSRFRVVGSRLVSGSTLSGGVGVGGICLRFSPSAPSPTLTNSFSQIN